MTFPAHQLKAQGGEIYCHIFENQLTGVVRDVYWSVTVDFAPLVYGEEKFRCNAMVEWLQIPNRDYRTLCQYKIALPDRSRAEASFYMTEHDDASSTSMMLHYLGDDRFQVDLEMSVDFHGYLGDDANPALPIAASTELKYVGLVVVPDNLEPKPENKKALVALASQFVDLAGYDPPSKQGFRYLFRPQNRKEIRRTR